MYRVDRNNFYSEQKNATIYTPPGVSRFLFGLLCDKINPSGMVLDPCVGAGSLLHPFREAGFSTLGIDIEGQGFSNTIIRDFLLFEADELPTPDLVIVNPPFNIDRKTQEIAARTFGRRPLLPEVWLRQIIDLWGKDIPIALFAPYGLRLNQTLTSRRWRNFADGTYPEIASIVSLPKNIYAEVLFHSEVLIFNVAGLKGHYFYDGQISGSAKERSAVPKISNPSAATRRFIWRCGTA